MKDMKDMKEYTSPEIEFVELEDTDIVATSECNGYVCPNMYGNTCAGNTYSGT